jgi:carboxymethylenebutenolidase
MPIVTKIQITADDGHRFAAWRAEPAGTPKGGIVALHAIYGLTDHMADVCARWAAAGYIAVAPQLYDRLRSNLVHPYDKPFDGVKSYAELTEAQIFQDIRAAVRAAGPGGAVAISGFCTGGTWAWRAAAAMDFPAQVNFYGSAIPALLDLQPLCPTILHYGDTDIVVSVAQIAEIRARHPEVELHVYPGAGHAFENIEQSGYDEAAGNLAWARSIAFMDAHLT